VLAELGALGVQVPHRGHVVGLQLAAVDDEHLVARARQLFDDGAPDEPGAAEDYDPQTAVWATGGLFSTIRSISPHSLACSGVMKKSRSIARSTSSSCRPQCLA